MSRRLWTGKRKKMVTRIPMVATTAPTTPAMAPGSRDVGWDGGLELVLELVCGAEVGDSVPTF